MSEKVLVKIDLPEACESIWLNGVVYPRGATAEVPEHTAWTLEAIMREVWNFAHKG